MTNPNRTIEMVAFFKTPNAFTASTWTITAENLEELWGIAKGDFDEGFPDAINRLTAAYHEVEQNGDGHQIDQSVMVAATACALPLEEGWTDDMPGIAVLVHEAADPNRPNLHAVALREPPFPRLRRRQVREMFDDLMDEMFNRDGQRQSNPIRLIHSNPKGPKK